MSNSFTSYDVPSAPPLPDDDGTDSYIAPNWVQRLYGPGPTPHPRTDRSQVEYEVPRSNAPAPYHPPSRAPDHHTGVYVPSHQPQQHRGPTPARPSSAALHLAESGGSTGQGWNHNPMHPPPATQTTRAAGGGGPSTQAKLERQVPIKRPSTGTAAGDGETGGCIKAGEVPDFAANPLRPSWPSAMRHRNEKQLRHFSKDVFGVPVPSTARPFSLSASPLQIGEACSGLGIYFSSLQAIILLSVALMACYIYPLVDNTAHQRWAPQYNLYLKEGAKVESAVCPKSWEVSSWMTEQTPGGHCASLKYSSSYDCAAKCTWSPARLGDPFCAAQRLPAYLNATTGRVTNRTAACQQHLPCGTDRFDPGAPDGPCFCCTMILDLEVQEGNGGVSTGQLWAFFVGQLVFLCWLLLLMHSQLRAVHTVGSRVLGVSDYSVLIKGIPRKRAADAPLAHWCAQYGSVVAAFNVPSIGDALRVGHRVSRLLVNKAEAEALLGSTSCNPLQWLYRLLAVGNYDRLITTLDREAFKLEIYERVESDPTGQGIATFEYTDSAAACVAEFDRPPARRLVDASLCGCTSTTPKLHGVGVHVTRAPQPSDIIWEHVNCTGSSAALRRAWSWTLTACIIAAGAGVQYGIAVLANQLRESRMEAEYSAGIGTPDAIADAHNKAIRLRATSIVAAAMVVTVNLLIAVAVRKLSWYERWTTRSSMERWVMVKLAVSQLLNSFAIPVLATWASGNKASWYSRGGLCEAALMTQLGMAVVPPLVHLLAPGDLLKKLFLAKFARTQAMLDRLLSPPEFWLAEQHAAAVNTLGLAVLYSPMLPISPLIAVLGLTIGYWANKYYALRIAAAPGNLNGQVQSSLNLLLRLLPLLQLILMQYLYFEGHPGMPAVFYTGLAFWLLFMAAPIRACLGTFTRRRPVIANGLSYNRLLGGGHSPENVEVYAPPVPPPCSRAFKRHVAETFAQLAPAGYRTAGDAHDVSPGGGGTWGGGAPAGYGTYAPGTAGVGGTGTVNDMMTLRGSLVGGIKEALRLMWDPNETADLVNAPPIEEMVGGKFGEGGGSADAGNHKGAGVRGSLRAQHSRQSSTHSATAPGGGGGGAGVAPYSVGPGGKSMKRTTSPDPAPRALRRTSQIGGATAGGGAAEGVYSGGVPRERRRTPRTLPRGTSAVRPEYDMFSPLGCNAALAFDSAV